MDNSLTAPATVRYRNPWHEPSELNSGPAFYETTATALEYRGYLFYERVRGTSDIVKDGVCVTQRAAKPGEGSKTVIDDIIRTGWPRGFPE